MSENQVYLINLDRRPDRLEHINKILPIKYDRISAVDGSKLNDYPEFSDLLMTIDNTECVLGEIGCKLSHYLIWKKILNSKEEYALILEDDILITDRTISSLEYLFCNIGNLKEEWDMIYVGGQWTPNYGIDSDCYMEKHKIKSNDLELLFEPMVNNVYRRLTKQYINNNTNENIFNTCFFRTAGAYIISKSGAKNLISFVEENKHNFMQTPLDMWLLKMELEKNIKSFDYFEHPFYQGGFDLVTDACLLKSDISRGHYTLFQLNLNNYFYTNNLFNTSELKKNIKNYLKTYEINNILEIGVFEGQAACFFSDYYLDVNGSSLDCVVNESTYNVFSKNIEKSKNYSKCQLHKESSQIFFNKRIDKLYNFIYIDGSHEPNDIIFDMENAFKFLKDRGIMYMDDYLADKNVMDNFIKNHENELIVIFSGYQLALQKVDLINLKSKFVFIDQKDQIGDDLYFIPNKSVYQYMLIADDDKKCISFNTLGFFKHKVDNLTSSKYFGEKDGIYIKKAFYKNLPTLTNESNIVETVKKIQSKNNSNLIRVRMIGNFWSSDQSLCEEFNLMLPERNFKSDNLEITWKDEEIDYYVIINKPSNDNIHYEPDRTIVFTMEPTILDNPYGTHSWGQWSKPDKNKFLFVNDLENNLNCVQWRLKVPYHIMKEKIEKKYNRISSIISAKSFFRGHKLRIDFSKYVQSKYKLLLDVYGKENYHNFENFSGALENDDPANVLMPYKYYFMSENNMERNYATEKIWEPILCESLCFYWGCPNLEEYIDKRAFVRLDLDDFEGSLNIIERAIKEDWWSQRIDIIRIEKQKILKELGFFPRLEKIIENSILF